MSERIKELEEAVKTLQSIKDDNIAYALVIREAILTIQDMILEELKKQKP